MMLELDVPTLLDELAGPDVEETGPLDEDGMPDVAADDDEETAELALLDEDDVALDEEARDDEELASVALLPDVTVPRDDELDGAIDTHRPAEHIEPAAHSPSSRHGLWHSPSMHCMPSVQSWPVLQLKTPVCGPTKGQPASRRIIEHSTRARMMNAA